MNSIEIAETIIIKPDSYQTIKEEANKLLKCSKVIGQYPTPLEVVADTLNLKESNDLFESEQTKSFLKLFSQDITQSIQSLQRKIRGMADLKKPLIYVAPDNNQRRANWARAHEIGHKVLEWHHLDYVHSDYDKSLSISCEELFDIEANHFAAEIIFQGNNFINIANEYRPEFENIFALSEMFGVSRHATSRKFVEENEESIAIITYYPSKNFFSQTGDPLFVIGNSHSASKTFYKKYGNIHVPSKIDTNHEWLSAYKTNDTQNGSISLSTINGNKYTFLWEAWWNSYTLLVLLRKAPRLRLIRSLTNT